jgi:replicative DNA helicase
VLTDIARTPGFRGRGLLARILYSWPENTMGRRPVGAPAVSAPVEGSDNGRLSKMVLLRPTSTSRCGCGWPATPTGACSTSNVASSPAGPHADLRHTTDWASKLNGAIAVAGGMAVPRRGAAHRLTNL